MPALVKPKVPRASFLRLASVPLPPDWARAAQAKAAPVRAQVEVLAGTTGTANRTLSRFGIELPAGRPADRSDRSPGRVTPARSTNRRHRPGILIARRDSSARQNVLFGAV
jgi:hypothetical protein